MNLFANFCVFLFLSCLFCEVTLKKTENFESNKYDEDRGLGRSLVEEDFLDVDKENLLSHEKIDQVPEEDFSGSGIDKHEEFPDDTTNKENSLTFRWVNGKWNPCSASCGGGFRTRSTLCQRMDKMLIVDEKYCFSEHKLKEQKHKCNSSPCPRWVVGNWSECNSQCTTKFSTRQVHCSAPPIMLTDSDCSMLPKPSRIQICFRNPNCTSVWKASEWSECRRFLTNRHLEYKFRTVTCVYQGTNERSYYCRHLGRPESLKRCVIKKRTHFQCRDTHRSFCRRFMRRKNTYCRFSGFRRMCCRSCRRVWHRKRIRYMQLIGRH